MNKQVNFDAFTLMIEANKGLLYKITHSFCKEIADRQDLMQDIVIKLWQSFASYQPQFKQSTWIYRVALNTAISYYRKEKTRRNINMPFGEYLLEVAGQQDDQRPKLRSDYLQILLMELKELDRALMLLYLEEKTHKEIAEIMGITPTNVATKIGRIKCVLKENFSKIII